MRNLYRFSLRHPRWAVGLGVLVTLAAAPGVLRLRIRTDGHALVPAQAPAVLIDQAIREAFGLEDPVVVLIRANGENGAFNFHTLTTVDELTRRFREMPDVEPWNVVSLATEKTDRVRPGTLIFRTFLEPPPQTEADLLRIRDDTRAIELYTGTLVSYDESATAVYVGVPAGADRTEFYVRINEIIDALGPTPERIDVIGAPIAEALLGTHILEDLGVPAAVLGHQTHRSDQQVRWAMPTTLYELRVLLARKIGLVPIALLIMAVVFLAAFRNLGAAVLPLMEVGACLVFVFGLMGYADVPIYLTIAVMPIILTAVGIADEIHIFSRYRDERRADPNGDARAAALVTMDEMFAPVVKTSITTSVGFLSFALSPIGPVQAFGIFTAVGVMFCMLWSLLVIPALLTMIRVRPRVTPTAANDDAPAVPTSPAFFRFGGIVARCRWPIVLAALAVIALAPQSVRRVVVQDSWIDGFAPDSEFHKATTFFNEQFLGTHMLLVCVTAGDDDTLYGELNPQAIDHRSVLLPGDLTSAPESLVGRRIYLAGPEWPEVDKYRSHGKHRKRVWNAVIDTAEPDSDGILVGTARRKGSPKLALKLDKHECATFAIKQESFKQPEMIETIERLETFLASHREQAVGGVLGPASYLKTTNFMARGRKLGSRSIAENTNRIDWLWKKYGSVRGQERLLQVIDEDYARAVVQVYLKNANFVDTARLMDKIREYEREHLAPKGISLELAGDTAVSQTLIGAIVTTQVRSLLVSLVGIFLVTALMGRSLLWGLLCVLPCALAVLINFAVMGMTGMPLGVATSMFSGMTLGIGVDFAIHFLERYRLARRRGLDAPAAISDASSATGPAILVDALAIALGFGVMMLSQVPANARLGGLVVLSIFSCLVVTMLLLPALLRLLPVRL